MYKVLYVDDDAALLDVATIFLERGGEFTIDTAPSADEGLRKMGTTRYDAIVSDYQMPDIDGITFLKDIRSKFGTIPFILFTGKGREEIVIQSLNAGADFYLQKGGEPKSQFAELASKIRQAVNRRRAEEKLLRNAERFRDILDTAPSLILSFNKEGKIVTCNLRSEDILGYPKDEVIGRNFADFANPAECSKLDRLFQELFSGKSVSGWILRFRKKDCSEIDVSLNATALATTTGRYYRAVCIIEDITRQLKTQAALLDNERKFRLLVDSAPDAIFIQANSRFAYLNSAALELFGARTPGDLIDEPVLDRFRPEDRAAAAERMRQLNVERKAVPLKEYTCLRVDGMEVDIEITAVPYTFGNSDGAVGFLRDISARKMQERNLAESRRVHETLLHNVPGMAYRCRNDPDWTMEFVSDGCLTLTGYSSGEMIASAKVTYGSLIVPEDRELVWNLVQEGIRTRQSFHLVYRIIDKDGVCRWMREQGQGTFNEQGELVAIEGYIADISERKRTEEALDISERKMNLLSSITSHDIRNQIFAIRSALELLTEGDGEKAGSKLLTIAEKALTEIEHQVAFAKEYRDIGMREPQWQDVGDKFRRASKNLLMLDTNLQIDTRGLEIFADLLLENVFYNLIDDALRYGGVMSCIRVSSHNNQDGNLHLVFEDNGVGIPDTDKERIFEKGFGKNTGLGLYLSREILSLTGITIRETGEPGKGARFEITVPKGAYRVGEPVLGS